MIDRLADRPRAYNEKDPWALDKLDRKQHIEPIQNIVLAIRDKPFVLSIDSPWGTGKSRLLEMWRDDLRNLRNHPCVLFNAWATDFAADPLVAFTEAIRSELATQQWATQAEHDNIGKQTVKLVRSVPAALPSIVGKTASLFAPGFAGDIKNLLEYLGSISFNLKNIDADKLKEALTRDAGDPVALFDKQQKEIDAFRKELETLVEMIGERSDKLPLVVMVDELDRCRPDYAVRLLERIKHIFGVKGIVFVLATDKRHLEASINHLYGHNTDADCYLRRFIDLAYTLPEPSTQKFVEYLLDEFGLKERFEANDAETFREILRDIFELYKLSLRDMAQVFTQLKAVILGYGANVHETAMVAALLALKKRYPRAYEQVIANNLKGLFSPGDSAQPIMVNDENNQPKKMPILRGNAANAQAYLDVYGYKLEARGTSLDRYRQQLSGKLDSPIRGQDDDMLIRCLNLAQQLQYIRLVPQTVIKYAQLAENFSPTGLSESSHAE